MGAIKPASVLLLDGVLLHEHPLIPAVPQCLDELVRDIGMVRKGHLRERESTNASESLESNKAAK